MHSLSICLVIEVHFQAQETNDKRRDHIPNKMKRESAFVGVSTLYVGYIAFP